MCPIRPSRPGLAATDEPGLGAPERNGLPDYEQFSQRMKKWLTLVPQHKLNQLLKCLYRAAWDKVALEHDRLGAQEDVSGLRTSIRSMRAAEKDLSNLLATLKAQIEKHGEAFKVIERSVKREDFEFSFDEITNNLKDAVEAAQNWVRAYAGLIHKDLREKPEKELALQKLPRGHVAGSILPHNYPARSKSPEIDHWFIGAASECLDRCRTANGEKIARYDNIISELFRGLGDESRSSENIRKELGRQEKHGRPAYDRPSAHRIDIDRELFPLGQNRSETLSRKAAASGKKRRT